MGNSKMIKNFQDICCNCQYWEKNYKNKKNYNHDSFRTYYRNAKDKYYNFYIWLATDKIITIPNNCPFLFYWSIHCENII